MSSTKVQIAELAEKVEKLYKRLKKDEKLGVIDGKEDRVKVNRANIIASWQSM